MPFDPAAGFEVVEEGGGVAVAEAPLRFDPSAGFEIVEEGGEAPSRFDPSAGFEVVEEGPVGTLADFMAQEDARVTEASPVTPGALPAAPGGNLAQPFPRTEAEAVAAQVPAGDEPAMIGEAPATVPRFGEPGTIARGVSDTMGGLAEWAMNSPAEAAATMTVVGPAVALRYGPEIAVHFAKDVAAGVRGDREALGRALAMTALVGGPAAFRGAKGAVAKRGAAKDTAMERMEAAVERPVAEEVPVNAPDVLPGAAGTFERVVGEKAAKGESDAIPKQEAETLPVGETPRDSAKVVEEIRVEGAPKAKAGEVARAGETPAVPPAEPPVIPATPGEGPVPQTIGVKVAAIDAQRADRGLPPVEPVMRRSHEEYYERAMERLEREPDAPDRVLAELAEKPRPMTPEEVVLVEHKLVDLTNQRDQAVWEGIKAADKGDAAGVKLYEARVGEMGAQLGAVEALVGRGDAAAGTLAGRALEARKMMLREDFSLAGLERQMRAANGFRQLDAKELATLRRTAEEFKAKNEALEARLREQTEVLAKAEARAELAKLKEMEAWGQAAVRGRVKEVVEKVGKVLDARADAARERLRGKLLSLSPADLKDIAEIGAANIYHVGVDFARWSERMVKELGEKVRPYLDEVWKESQRVMDEAVRGEAGVGMDKGPKPANAPRTPRDKAAAKDAEAAKEAIERRLRKRIEEYEGRIARGEFKRAPKAPPPGTPEIRRLQFELDGVKEKFYERMFEESLKRRTGPRKAYDAVIQTGHLVRALRTSGEFSAVLRQGKLVMFTRPTIPAKALPEMLLSTFSEKQAFEAEQALKRRDNFPEYKAFDLAIMERKAALNKAEEIYLGRWNEKIPLVGRIIKASHRAYTTFLNRVRADFYDVLKAATVGSGEIGPAQGRILANLVNVFTGRGSIGVKAEHAAEAFAATFFAPRFVASRFQAVLGQPIYYGLLSGKAPFRGEGAAVARRRVAIEYGRAMTGAAAYYTLLSLAGYQIGTTFTSSDLGKAIIGKTRVDPLAGLAQVTVLLSRIASGKKTSTKGKVANIRGDVPYGGDTVVDVGANFLRTKLAPVPSVLVNALQGKDVIGRPYTGWQALEDLTVPITYSDIGAVMEENGVDRGTALMLLAIFGEGVQVHGEISKEPR